MRFFLDTFKVGFEGAFQPAHTDENFAIIDLRPDTTVVDGFCLVATPTAVGVPSLDFGDDDLDGRMNPSRRRAFGNRLGVTLDQDTFRGQIAELMMVHGSFPDKRKWNPIKAGRDGRHKIFLGGLIYDAPSVVGASYSDDFNRANENLDDSANWTYISGGTLDVVSNELAIGDTTAGSAYRYEQDLSSDNHYAQATFVTDSGTGSDIRVMTRWSASAQTYYLGRIISSGTNSLLIQSVVTGTPTNILLEDRSTPAAPWDVKLESDGSTQELTGSGFIGTVTDSSITGNVRAGVGSRNWDTNDRADDWIAADLPSPGPTPAAVVGSVSVPQVSRSGGGTRVAASATGSVTVPQILVGVPAGRISVGVGWLFPQVGFAGAVTQVGGANEMMMMGLGV